MGRRISAAIIAALFLASCSAPPPSRFKRDKTTPPGCGYHVESAGSDGFVLEAFYRQFSFMPDAEQSIQGARKCFRASAFSVARTRGRLVRSPSAADMATTVTRNANDGYYSIYVTGRVWYATE